jgi:hypothetical protein
MSETIRPKKFITKAFYEPRSDSDKLIMFKKLSRLSLKTGSSIYSDVEGVFESNKATDGYEDDVPF